MKSSSWFGHLQLFSEQNPSTIISSCDQLFLIYLDSTVIGNRVFFKIILDFICRYSIGESPPLALKKEMPRKVHCDGSRCNIIYDQLSDWFLGLLLHFGFGPNMRSFISCEEPSGHIQLFLARFKIGYVSLMVLQQASREKRGQASFLLSLLGRWLQILIFELDSEGEGASRSGWRK